MKQATIIIASFIMLITSGLIYFTQHRNATEGAHSALSINPTELLQKYIRINTSHPHADYQSAVNLFKAHATQDGFTYQEINLPSGNPALIISYQGTDASLPALALNHHMDVVPALNTAEWTCPPFAGDIKDGKLYGRGTQDMKGVGVTHYCALQKLKSEGFVPTRSIHIVLVPDEERGGFKGTKELVETGIMQKLNIGFVIDEAIPSGDEQALYLKYAERKPIHVLITSKGPQGHGAQLHNENALHEMILFLDKVANFQKKQQINKKEVPGNLLSMHITSCTAGVIQNGQVAMNTIPGEATATIDIRVPHHMSVKKAQEFLDSMIKEFPNVTYEIKAMVQDAPARDTHETPLYQALEKIITAHGLNVKPLIFEATTDIRYHLACGIDGVGFTPFTTVNNIHGTDEFVPVDDLLRGTEIMYDFIKQFCA